MTTLGTTVPIQASGTRRRLDNPALLLVPGILFLVVCFGYPLLEMAARSFTDPSASANYGKVFETSIYARSLRVTFQTALIVTATCLLLGYPYAYVMSRARPTVAILLGMLVLVPFWMSLLVRTYAWTVWLQDTGVINWVLMRTGIVDEPVSLIRNTLGVTIGITHIMLPFMILPLFAVMRRISPDYMPAAASLGARPWAAFRLVYFKLSLPGVYAGALLVFILTLGFYITPALLGSPSNAMFSELIVSQVNEQLNFGVGAALGMVLLVVTLLVLWLGSRLVGVGRMLGEDAE
jgi:putative spermidine/putrescine transport system permease protein